MVDMSVAGLFFVSLFALAIGVGCLVHNVMYIAKTAPSNGQSTVLWIVVVLLFGFVGFAIYLFVIKETMKAILWLILPVIISVVFFFVITLMMVATV